ncbi:MAG: prephenate dehydrogenase [Thermoleophilaceae bacterium]|nr:prephenate dehydrogenase [Thermoleophilaceae bacterium]
MVGVGLIGGSIALAARENGAEVVGYDADPGVMAAAIERAAVDRVAPSIEAAVADADAVFACAPVGALPELLNAALKAAPDDCVVTDVGSTKRSICAAVDDERFIGGHPVAGLEVAGVQHARADLFEGAAWYLTPGKVSSGVLYERLHGILKTWGARPVAIDPDSHDRLLATVSHLPHVLANVLVSQAARTRSRENEQLPSVGPSFRDATRVAGANSDIWTDIYVQNAEAIADEVEVTAMALTEVAKMLRAGYADGLRAWNERAREDRRRLLEAELAGGAMHELRVTVPNRPGIVAALALALGRGGVNIVDMTLAPAPDNSSGAITFWVSGDGAAERASELIAEQGYPVGEDE